MGPHILRTLGVILAVSAILSFPLQNADALSYVPALQFSSPVLKLPYSPTLTAISSGQQVVISTAVSHAFGDEDFDLVALIEVRDSDGVTEYLAWQSGEVKAGSQMEIGVSWIPPHGGFYEIRTFAITNDWENPQVLSEVATSQIEIRQSCKGSAACITGTVTNIVDGDTLDVGETRIRLALVDTPERGGLGYSAAKTFTAEQCPVGSEAVVDEDDGQTEGSFGRMIAAVYCGEGGRSLNEALLHAGHAELVREFCNVSEFADERWARVYGCAADNTMTTEVECEQSSLCTYQLMLGNTTHPVNFRMNGTIKNMTADPEVQSLTIELRAEIPTSLQIAIPREVVDSREGPDQEFAVFVDDIPVDIEEISIQAREWTTVLGISENPEEYRILVIPISADSERVDIMGTLLL